MRTNISGCTQHVRHRLSTVAHYPQADQRLVKANEEVVNSACLAAYAMA